jgi:D-arabinose 1-dehydrogenase-like Zn-dependent alcohol dehydrogenase
MADAFSLGVRAQDELAFFDLELPALGDGDVLVRTLYSGLSAGDRAHLPQGHRPRLRLPTRR